MLVLAAALVVDGRLHCVILRAGPSTLAVRHKYKVLSPAARTMVLSREKHIEESRDSCPINANAVRPSQQRQCLETRRSGIDTVVPTITTVLGGG